MMLTKGQSKYTVTDFVILHSSGMGLLVLISLFPIFGIT